MDYPTRNNRLLYYELWDTSQTPEMKLRTVRYTYYDDGNASNITIEDEYIDPVTTPGDPEDYNRLHDLALYYNPNGSLRIALRDSWELNQYGNPAEYDPDNAHEFRYDDPQARYLDAFYDELFADQDPNRWPLDQTVSWTEYAGGVVYNDADHSREEDPENPGTYVFDFTEIEHYLGTAAHESVDTGDIRYHHGDLIASTMLTTDNTGGTAAPTVSYTAFGEIIGDANDLDTRYQYAGGWGYESDLLTLEGVNPNLPPITLQHLGHRWYQPDIGRFVQRDPIGIEGALNVYAYCDSRPNTMVDPNGTAIITVAIVTAAGVVIVYTIVVWGYEWWLSKDVNEARRREEQQRRKRDNWRPTLWGTRSCVYLLNTPNMSNQFGPTSFPTDPISGGGLLINEGIGQLGD